MSMHCATFLSKQKKKPCAWFRGKSWMVSEGPLAGIQPQEGQGKAPVWGKGNQAAPAQRTLQAHSSSRACVYLLRGQGKRQGLS